MSSGRDTNELPSRKPGKYQPKSSARRSETERAEQDQAESSRQRKRQQEATRGANRVRGSSNHAGGRGGSGFRGGLSGWHDQSQATGFLGGAMSSASDHPEIVLETAPSPRQQSPVRQDLLSKPLRSKKQTSKKSTKKTTARMKEEPSESLDVDEDEDGDMKMIDITIEERRNGINVDLLAYNNLISDDEDGYDEAGNRRKALYPVRLKRKPHVDRKTTIDTTASSKHSKQMRQEAIEKGVSVSDVQIITDDNDMNTAGTEQQRGRTSHDDNLLDNTSQQVKTEEDIKPSMLDGRASGRTRRRKTREYVELSDDDVPEVLLPQPGRQQERRPLFSKPVLQTPEDHEEWKRHLADMKAIAEELGNDNQNLPSRGTKGRRDDKVYLFQLPPVMPNLRSPSDIILDEQQGRMSTTELHSQVISDGNNDKVPARPQDLVQATTVKVEDEVRGAEGQMASMPNPSLDASSEPKFKGPIGTLTVYESGATALDWGGIEFQLERAMGSMLQETLLIDDNQELANSMSQVVASFIVKPNWDALLEADS